MTVSPFVRILPAMAWHAVQLLSFSHDGRGLPRVGSSLLVLLLGLKLVLTGMVVTQLLPDVGLIAGLIKSLLAAGLLYLCAATTRQSYAFSGYLLLWSAVDVGLLVLSLVLDVIPGAFITTCYAWGLLAFIVLLLKAAPNHD